MSNSWIPHEEWKTIVKNIPIVSVDLVVLHDGGVVLGKRTNEPAKGEWFVPGGRVLKNESLQEAVHRVAKEELDVNVQIEESLGAYEHFYENSDVAGCGKHYVANGFVVSTTNREKISPDEQSEEMSVFGMDDLTKDLHKYVRQYLSDASQIGYPRDSKHRLEDSQHG